MTSEGEKIQVEENQVRIPMNTRSYVELMTLSQLQVEEGREAEATIQTPSSNTRSRTPRLKLMRGRGRNNASERPTPIVWDCEL